MRTGGSDNTKASLAESIDGAPVVEVYDTEFLNCNQMQDFWVTWQKGNITVGRGNTINVRAFLTYQDADSPYTVSCASFATSGNNGEWRILREQGQ